jgi:hypothetical protein
MSENLLIAIQKLSESIKKISEEAKSRNLETSANSVEFKSNKKIDNVGRGLVWKSDDGISQFVLGENDKFISSEGIDLRKGKSFSISNSTVLTDKELGPSIIRSNLQQLGILKNLDVAGDVSIADHLFYNAGTGRLGLGIDSPSAKLSVAGDAVEVVIDVENGSKGRIGCFGFNSLDIITDDKSRINVSANGNIFLGNRSDSPIQVSVHGKLNVGTTNMDNRVDLQVDGPIKFENKIHSYSNSIPTTGTHSQGDVIWNSAPEAGKPVGWVCVRSGSPGAWLSFGIINNR